MLVLEYDGTAYHGFQRQPTLPTVQATLESALSRHTGEPVRLRGASRTDAGVHATAQVVNLTTCNPVPIDRVCAAINSLLPPNIAAWLAVDVHRDFNARRCASSKAYTYLVQDGGARPGLLSRFRHYHPLPLDVEAMAASLTTLVGQHDFTAFSAKGDESPSNLCHLKEAACLREGPLVKVRLRADRFLYRMVRLIVGGLIKVGEGRWPVDRLNEILSSCNREQAPPAAPARGLFLEEVVYSCSHLQATFHKEVL